MRRLLVHTGIAIQLEDSFIVKIRLTIEHFNFIIRTNYIFT